MSSAKFLHFVLFYYLRFTRRYTFFMIKLFPNFSYKHITFAIVVTVTTISTTTSAIRKIDAVKL